MTMLFICGVMRVAFVTAYLTLVFAATATAYALMVPFVLTMWAIVVYDALPYIRRMLA